jgi:hypothetical protein
MASPTTVTATQYPVAVEVDDKHLHERPLCCKHDKCLIIHNEAKCPVCGWRDGLEAAFEEHDARRRKQIQALWDRVVELEGSIPDEPRRPEEMSARHGFDVSAGLGGGS